MRSGRRVSRATPVSRPGRGHRTGRRRLPRSPCSPMAIVCWGDDTDHRRSAAGQIMAAARGEWLRSAAVRRRNQIAVVDAEADRRWGFRRLLEHGQPRGSGTPRGGSPTTSVVCWDPGERWFDSPITAKDGSIGWNPSGQCDDGPRMCSVGVVPGMLDNPAAFHPAADGFRIGGPTDDLDAPGVLPGRRRPEWTPSSRRATPSDSRSMAMAAAMGVIAWGDREPVVGGDPTGLDDHDEGSINPFSWTPIRAVASSTSRSDRVRPRPSRCIAVGRESDPVVATPGRRSGGTADVRRSRRRSGAGSFAGIEVSIEDASLADGRPTDGSSLDGSRRGPAGRAGSASPTPDIDPAAMVATEDEWDPMVDRDSCRAPHDDLDRRGPAVHGGVIDRFSR